MKVITMRSFILCFVGLFFFGCTSVNNDPSHNAVQTEKNTHHKEILSKKVSTQHSINAKHKQTSSQSIKVQQHTPKTTDLWVHIANNLHLTTYQNRSLQKRIDWYLKQPNYLITVSKRAAPYLYHIVRKVEQKKLPMEIALLPFVESDFRPTVTSSQQAVGIWQLVGATAYHFGIKSDQWYDGRKDVLASTDAALNYLSYLYERFDK